MPDGANARQFFKLLHILLCALLVWLGLRHALVWVLPFLLALLTARLTEPLVLSMRRRLHFKRSFAAAISTVLLAGGACLLTVLLTGQLLAEAQRFSAALPQYIELISARVTLLAGRIGAWFGTDAGGVAEGLTRAGGAASEKLSQLLVDAAASLLGSAPRAVLFAVTYLVSVYFISAQYPAVVQFILRQIPARLHDSFFDIKNGILTALGKWLRAELSLMFITFCELCLGLTLLGVEYSFMLALMISLIDALPVLGVGTVLIPWSLISILGGRGAFGACLIVLYGVISLARSVLEPRLVGAQLGLDPLATLIAVYLGYCIFGLAGMVLAPILLIVLTQLNAHGRIKLWK